MNTQQIIDKYCKKSPNHIHHPFHYFCLYCKFEFTCIYCESYEHDFCYTCQTELSDKAKDDSRTARFLYNLLHGIPLTDEQKTEQINRNNRRNKFC